MQRYWVMRRQRAQPGLPHKINSHLNGAVWHSQANLLTILGTDNTFGYSADQFSDSTRQLLVSSTPSCRI
ncbi:hypothetical protein HZ326_10006 [Fusarium oxysporum f. sp. albedinis]|nr:hypothetical protein HZ326_10006 [Fusarium oxysporum f. sp. albedinis]